MICVPPPKSEKFTTIDEDREDEREETRRSDRHIDQKLVFEYLDLKLMALWNVLQEKRRKRRITKKRFESVFLSHVVNFHVYLGEL